jgi:hypothetical protein
VTGPAPADLEIVDEGPPSWWHRAACRAAIDDGTATLADFFPNVSADDRTRRNAYVHAIAICATCPVRRECLDAALHEERDARERYGCRGGLTPRQRRDLGRRRSRRKRAGVYDDDATTLRKVG